MYCFAIVDEVLAGTYKPITLAAFAVSYFMLACWTCGSWIPSGQFIPGLLIGATWGRLCGIGVTKLIPGVRFRIRLGWFSSSVKSG